jgi:hypothetical protein
VQDGLLAAEVEGMEAEPKGCFVPKTWSQLRREIMAEAPGENDSPAKAPSPVQNIYSDAVMADVKGHWPEENGTPPYSPMQTAPALLWDVIDVQGDIHVMAHLMGCDVCETYVQHVGHPGWRRSAQFGETERFCHESWVKTLISHPEVQRSVRHIVDRKRCSAVQRAEAVKAAYEERLTELGKESNSNMDNLQAALKLSAEHKEDLARIPCERNQLRTELMETREDADGEVDEETARCGSGRAYAADTARA